jgi:hypothetical protein
MCRPGLAAHAGYMLTEDAFRQMARDRRVSYEQQACEHRLAKQFPRNRSPRALSMRWSVLRRVGRAHRARPVGCAV